MSDEDPHDHVKIKGFEYVRSDSAQVTRKTQERVLSDILLSEDPRERIEPYLREVVDDIHDGEYPLYDLARPKGIGQALDEYGWKVIGDLDEDEITSQARKDGGMYVQRPAPTYRGAKYADDHFPWEDLGEGSKPAVIPIGKVRAGEYPAVYTYDSYPSDGYPEPPEVDTPVDALAMEEPDKLPDQFVVDYDTIVEKTVRGKIEDIIETIDLQWDDIMTEGTQTGLDAFC